jgi:type IV secretory pathway VirB2 component (pilin)
MLNVRKLNWPAILCGAMVFAGFAAISIFAQSTTVDETTIATSLRGIITIITRYVVPGICVLVIIKGGIGMMNGDPNALKTIIMAIVGAVISLGASALVSLVTGGAVTGP